jgi:hypothetical protein
MKKRFLSLLLALCMTMTLLPMTAWAVSAWDGTSPAADASYAFSGGDGSSATPYLISTAADLAQLAENVNAGIVHTNKSFVQTADIDLNSGVTFTFDPDTGLVTVTKGASTFYLGTGILGDASGANTVFDVATSTAGSIYSDTAGTAGADTIGLHSWTPIGTQANRFMGYFYGQGYTVSGIYINNATNYQGLFGYAQGSIKNVGVTNCYIRGGTYVGGVVGYSAISVANSSNTGLICGSNDVGGIVGRFSSSLYNCYNAGMVTGATRVGGVAGSCYGFALYNCYSTSTVSGTTNVGSVLGYKEPGSIFSAAENCGTIGAAQQITAGTPAECGGAGAQTLLAGLTSGTSTLLEALNAWVANKNQNWNYTWKTDSGGTNGGYPILDAAYVPVYAVSAATNGVTANGVTATATFGETPYVAGAMATVTITLSGTAAAAGTHTIGLTSGGDVGSITAPATVTKTVAANATPMDTFQFTFTMPAAAVDDLVITNTFIAATVPDAPTIGTVTAGDAQATVNFTAPASNGGAAITGYTVTSNPGGITATGAGSPITVNGLTNGTAYTFTVTATNGVGTSADSAASNSVTPQAPSNSGGSHTKLTPVTKIKNGGSVTGSNVTALASGEKTLTVDGEKGEKLVFDTESLKGIVGQTSGNIKVEMTDVSPSHQDTLPGKLVYSLAVSSGSKTISNFGGSVTVTLPYTLKDGETADKVTVWYLAGDGTMTEIPCTYDAAKELATFKATHFSLYVVGVDTPWVSPFTDVAAGEWFYRAVEFVNRNGLFAGTGADTFSPNSPMTRAMLWTVLGRADGQSLSGSGVFDAARIWAMSAGITDGTSPDGNVTREQVVTILWRYAGSPVAANIDMTKFSDADNISSYAKNAFTWAIQKGIIKGDDNDNLNPNGMATRAEVATIFTSYN